MFDGKTIWFVVRGINGNPSDLIEWEYEARDFIVQNLKIPAVSISYASTFMNAWHRRRKLCQRFARVLRGYTSRDWRVNIMAHSYGTVVATDAIKFLGWPRIENLHLICGACDSDFQRIGINGALRMDNLASVHVWTAGRDTAMLYERLVLGKLLFGIPDRSEPLGLVGPRNIAQQYASKVIEHWDPPWDKYDHSDCWLGKNLSSTMQAILAASSS